jgi:RHS repeat-associated protein
MPFQQEIFVSGNVQEGTPFDTGLYAYDGAGNVAAMGADTFTYDDLSRLATAGVHGYDQDFAYDPYGNLVEVETTPPGGSRTTETIPVDPATNRLSGAGYAHDGSGNVTLLDGITYLYDPMNLTKNRSGDGTQWAAIYTADDERLVVWDTAQGVVQETWTLRGLDGLLLREYFFGSVGGELLFADGFESGDVCAWSTVTGGPACEGLEGSAVGEPAWSVRSSYVYRDGALLADANDGTSRHYHLDHLGSVRQITDEDGFVAEGHDYLPYGTEVPGSSAGLRFTGHERDGHLAGSGDDLDYMHARYCSPGLGRFLSVDPMLIADLRSPQFWNRYSYASNSPLKFIDPTGKYVTSCQAGDEKCAAQAKAFEAARQELLKHDDEQVRSAAAAYGDIGTDNGITVGFGSPSKGKADTLLVAHYDDAAGRFSMSALVTVAPGLSGAALSDAVGHEGDHIQTGAAFVDSLNRGGNLDSNPSLYASEFSAYRVTDRIFRDAQLKFQGCEGCPAIGFGVLPAAVDHRIEQMLASPRWIYQVTPGNPGPGVVNFR